MNDSVHSWECIRNHILGVWNHSDFSIDISKLHQDIQNMKQMESDFSSQWLSNSLFENLEGYLSHGSFSTIMINAAMSLCLLVLICVTAPCLFRILSRSVSALSTEFHAAATAAKSLQSCPTLCNPIDGSPPGSPVPGILQARTLEWVAISFSNA